MRPLLPLVSCLLAACLLTACSADQPDNTQATTELAAGTTAVAEKANADVEAAMAEAQSPAR